jgi:pilus assembly protein Flp/PilA
MRSGRVLARCLRVVMQVVIVLQSFTSACAYRVEGVMKKKLKEFIVDESGATAIEYGLIAAGIALAIISALNGVGTALKTKFGLISTSLK